MKIIIYAYRFDENSGGKIVLHQLCHLLNEMGIEARLWENYRLIFDKKNIIKSLFGFLKYFRKTIHRRFTVNKNWNTPIATKEDIKDAIVIYPEIVEGNPLNAKYVVRWLLHKPGFHNGKVEYNKDDLIVGYGKNFSTEEYEITDENLLTITYVMTDIYKQTNFDKRTGSCYMVRKGTNKEFVHDKDAICVDGYSHEELAKVFNKVDTFISYDTYTFYSKYAALCGCKSIIIPDENVSKKEWHPNESKWYGLSYGLDDIEYALQTKDKMIENIKEQEQDNVNQVKNFVKLYKGYFVDKQ